VASVASQAELSLGGPPVVGFLLIVQVSDASDKRVVALAFRPIDCSLLRSGGVKHVVGMVFSDEVVNGAPFRTALGACFDIYIRHGFLSRSSLLIRMSKHNA
jgi:hypothetical protein